MANRMTEVIKIRRYSYEETIARLNSFNTWGQITPEEYHKLMLFAHETYHPIATIPEIEGGLITGEATEGVTVTGA